MDKQQLIAHLQLEPHLEGGYFRRTYAASRTAAIEDVGDRLLMSSIFYLLTDDSPIGFFHRNRSDILHYWQGGSSLTYYLIDSTGQLRQVQLGPNLDAGEQLQLLVTGDTWKATELHAGEFGLLSEAVSPGFEYRDMELATSAGLLAQFPHLAPQRALLQRLCKHPR